MAIVLYNLSDDSLQALADAVRHEQRVRFLRNADKYPKLLAVCECSSVDGVKAYRAAYDLSLIHAHMLYNHYHR